MPALGLQPSSGGENQVAGLPAGHKHLALSSRKSLPTVTVPLWWPPQLGRGGGTVQLEGCTWAPTSLPTRHHRPEG